jgi:hypothetical protein
MTYTKEKFETFLAGLKKKERQNPVMKKRLELKKRIA